MAQVRHQVAKYIGVHTSVVEVYALQVLVVPDHSSDRLHHQPGHLLDCQVIDRFFIDELCSEARGFERLLQCALINLEINGVCPVSAIKDFVPRQIQGTYRFVECQGL